MATNRLPAASRKRNGNSTINLEIGARAQAACGSILTLADMRSHFPKFGREEALKELTAFIAELDAGWERDGLDWAPGLLTILRAFVAEASKQSPDRHQLESLRGDVHAYFKRYKFLKGMFFVREWVDMIY